MIGSDIRDAIIAELGTAESKPVLEAVDNVLLEVTMPNPATMNRGKTIGDWNTGLPWQPTDERPANALSYTIIDEMLKSGIIRFALDMKRAQILSVFRNKRSIQILVSDKKFKKVAEKTLETLLPSLMFEATWSALAYGAAFFETVWETKTAYELGASDRKGGQMYTVPKRANLVPHKTVRHILRKKDGSFDGFTQIPPTSHIGINNFKLSNEGDIVVSPESALVLPYNGFSRNLWGESLLKPIYPLWFWYEIVLRAMVQFSQLMGDPPRKGKAPSRRKVRMSKSGDLVDAIDYLLALSANLPKTNSIVIPSDVDENGKSEWELEYMQMPDRSQPFVQIIELFNKLIIRASIATDTSLITSDSVSSAATAHTEATALTTEMMVSTWVSYINDYFLPQFSKYNFGSTHTPLELEVQGLDPKEREFMSQVLNIAGNSAEFQDFFYGVDWTTLGRLSGIPMLDEEGKQASIANAIATSKKLNDAINKMPAVISKEELNGNTNTKPVPTGNVSDDSGIPPKA